ncbi:MAG: hypothetical protein IPO18_19310 [bacterium]|nr:hypothetical protein [bacterium]
MEPATPPATPVVAGQPRRAFLVSHTHWDREWYLPFNRFRVHLLEVVTKVLDQLEADPSFRAFVLDGQGCALEDFLAAAPHERTRIDALAAAGRLAVGPWYILPDEFLVSGEATVRNLQYGRLAVPAGGLQKVGYMPDSFGHIAQMPQLLRLCGIDSFIFTRGLGDEAAQLGWLFRWAAPDGSEVLAVNQCDGYCNAGGLGYAEIWHAHTARIPCPERAAEKVGELFAKMAARPGAEPALLNNGCDHFGPQQRFGDIMARLRDAWAGTEFTHGRFEDFLAAARAEAPDASRPAWSGELLGGRDHLILSGVWSSRMPLKQENEYCQGLLTRVVEPLAAAAHFLGGESWPGGLLDTAWKELLRNHPHDSICGCSTDEVHREMVTRFGAVRQTGEHWLARRLNRICPMFGPAPEDDRDTVIAVANPLPRQRTEVVERVVVLQPFGYDLGKLRLVDEQGRPVPCEIVRRRFLERFWGIDYRAEISAGNQLAMLEPYLKRFGDRIIGNERDQGVKDCFLHLRFLARDLPAVGHALYRLTDEPGPLPARDSFTPVSARRAGEDAVLDNGLVRAVLHPDGTIDLTDLANGHVYDGLNLLEDSEDAGDEYDFGPAPVPETVFAGGAPGELRVIDSTPLLGAAVTVLRFDLPRSLTRGRRGRDPRTTPCDVEVRITLATGSRRLDIETTINNRAFDHRLRAWFPTGLACAEVVSDGAFMLNRRPCARPTNPDWPQPAPPTWPQQDWSVLGDGKDSLAVFNRGLPEFEVLDDGQGRAIFALTLMRCVDWLSRDDFAARKNTNAGPTLYTPDAQLIGRRTFHYAVMPGGGDLFADEVPFESARYRAAPPTHQGVGAGSVPAALALACSEPRVSVTAIMRARDGEGLVVRLCNLDGAPVEAALRLGFIARACRKTGLLEDELPVSREAPMLAADGRSLTVPLAGGEIATVLIGPAAAGRGQKERQP